MKLYELHAIVEAVCPIWGLNSDGRINFKPEATTEQRAAAQAIVDAHIAEIEPAL